jgi:hypothetical protein
MDGPAIDVVRAYEYDMHRLIAEDRGDPPPPAPDAGTTAPVPAAPRPEAEPDPAMPEPGASDDGATQLAAADVHTLMPSASVTESTPAEDAPQAAPADRPSASDEAVPAQSLAGTAPGVAEPIDETGERPGERASRVAETSAAPSVEQALAPLGQPQAAEPDALPREPAALAGQGQPAEAETALDGLSGSASDAAQPSVSDQESAALAPLECADALSGEPARLEPAPSSSSGEDESPGPYRMTRIELLDAAGREAKVFRFGDVLRLRVGYENLAPDMPDVSCGLAVMFERTSDFEPVMHFESNVPHAGAEIPERDAGSRQAKGRNGVIEARIDPLQLCSGEYYVSLGMVSNRSGARDFSQYAGRHFQVTVLPSGFPEPSVFYPLVCWRSGNDRR